MQTLKDNMATLVEDRISIQVATHKIILVKGQEECLIMIEEVLTLMEIIFNLTLTILEIKISKYLMKKWREHSRFWGNFKWSRQVNKELVKMYWIRIASRQVMNYMQNLGKEKDFEEENLRM